MWQEKVLKELIIKIIEADRENLKLISALMDLDIHVENKAFFSNYKILKEMIDLEFLLQTIESYEKEEITVQQLGDILYEHIEKNKANKV
ncbi:hypothetical protein U9R71_13585 [Bacillus toyonensis]|uniref:Carrier domain-containing protein n=1 Tax=Bacillus toyonensis TaxID=155322 RepID=A0AB73QXT9_9BACI|nr:hypothetical protein [Bacillus toyonensis]OTX04708.1 hypothetical protein BK712_19065 [Bacillus thuringiensis serovar seoulensis]MBH0358275.1 hypothetical protein [Bacillus toyonensis biovar Thuringiensis]MED3201882.1 hypothetical protein [Bacillus toyonensis]NKW97314.1 hypothetical protein [Bacillus toyonensis]PEI86513.1 hypothetical protein CN678_11555 [Bacillus toyonensis]